MDAVGSCREGHAGGMMALVFRVLGSTLREVSTKVSLTRKFGGITKGEVDIRNYNEEYQVKVDYPVPEATVQDQRIDSGITVNR